MLKRIYVLVHIVVCCIVFKLERVYNEKGLFPRQFVTGVRLKWIYLVEIYINSLGQPVFNVAEPSHISYILHKCNVTLPYM